jgi:hypothetical protein
MVAAQRESTAKSPALGKARRQLATMFGFDRPSGASTTRAERIAPWRATLFTAWCLVVCAAYAWSLFRAFN